MAAKMHKDDWAEDVEDFEDQPTITEEDGIKTIVEYRTNDDGRKVKVTRKIKMKLVTEMVNKVVAERKKLAKFGLEAGKKPGPDPATTSLGDQVYLKLQIGFTDTNEDESQNKLRSSLKGKNIVCRICKGEHFTSKCPYKDTLQPLQDLASANEPAVPAAEEDAGTADAAGGPGGKSAYVPPHLRNRGPGGTGPAGASMDGPRERRDDNPTLRITNLSEDTEEADLQELCRPFGSLARVFLSKDRETGMCRGYAFVSYYDKADAERAMAALSGFGYDNLILHVEWAKAAN
ncbi:translation initiation factor eIF3 subunit g [Tieghemiomyces parasiticus]|uniref:Eukaryotic translation initiation factor 3 subunit G n=1 Tax=Tieghemiomyces parasiticus TaxID=78921 RepID=A0A9W8E1I5_9FUNG|nr:translation initiation factor eIF3 subunit g [Tieghemiomyces parasiticus]